MFGASSELASVMEFGFKVSVQICIALYKAPFTRYDLLSNRLSNGFDNRENVYIHDTVVKPD